MIRRVALSAIALTIVGGVSAPAIADTLSSSSNNEVVCVLGTNHSTGARDGVCIWIPKGSTQ